MPTARARHMITETDEIARALDEAAKRWPELAGERSELIRRVLVSAANDAVTLEEARIARKREAILTNAGTLSGIWPQGWLQELRGEWPE